LREPEWRPFQLAFVLLNLGGLIDRKHVDRETADLLFFPTGGGKTEAYLGLAALVIAHRRLTGSGVLGAGVAVIMRYTLRLLTLDHSPEPQVSCVRLNSCAPIQNTLMNKDAACSVTGLSR